MEEKSSRFAMIATTMKGLEHLLALELKALGARKIEVLPGAVSFRGKQHLFYEAHLCLRTALKILKPIVEFKAYNEDEFYEQVKKIDWFSYLEKNKTFAIDSSVKSITFNHSKYMAFKTKDAIVDLFREKIGERPSVDVKNPYLRINVHINDNDCSISLDGAGDSLHKRGYRVEGHEASMKEVLAAGLVLLSGWDKKSDFIDPMCGSGTIAIEAALYAYNIAPGLLRDKFSFMNWPDFDQPLWEKIKENVKGKQENAECFITAIDENQKSVDSVLMNIRKAGLADKIKVVHKNFFDYKCKASSGVLIMNPPYGDRLKNEQIDLLYKNIGDQLKKEFKGFDAWIFTGNHKAIKKIGLKPEEKVRLYNGPIECGFNKYSIY